MTTIGRRLSDNEYADYRFIISDDDGYAEDLKTAVQILGEDGNFVTLNNTLLVGIDTDPSRLMLLRLKFGGSGCSESID
jgi:hypothetical protein